MVRGLIKRTKNDQGFTLIELLVVVIIIGILASIAVIGISGARKSAYGGQCTANASQLTKAVVAYQAAYGGVPGEVASITAVSSTYASSTITIVYTADNTFALSQPVTVTGLTPFSLNVTNQTITAKTATTFTVQISGSAAITATAVAGTAVSPLSTSRYLTKDEMLLLTSAGSAFLSAPVPYVNDGLNNGPYQLRTYIDATTRTVTSSAFTTNTGGISTTNYPGCTPATIN